MSRELDFSDDPYIASEKIMRLIESALPYLVSKYDADAGQKQAGIFGLSNLAAVLAHINFSADYDSNRTGVSRSDLSKLALTVLKRIDDLLSQPDSAIPDFFSLTYLGFTALLLKEQLSLAWRGSLIAKIIAGADSLLDCRLPSGLYYDTKAEENCWNAGPLVVAQALAPDNPNCRHWQTKAIEFFMNAYSREEDNWDETIIDGKPVKDWVYTANVLPDFTTENHGGFHSEYQTCNDNYAIPYLVYKKYLGKIPQALTWNWQSLHAVTSRMVMSEGYLFHPVVGDYPPFCQAGHCHYFALMADALKDPLALWALKRVLCWLDKIQRVDNPPGRLTPSHMINSNAVLWDFHAASFLVFAHALAPFNGIEIINDEQAMAVKSGPWHSPYCRFVLHKGRRLFSSYALRKNSAVGYILPQGYDLWSDFYTRGGYPNLCAEIRNEKKEKIEMELSDHIIGLDGEEVWGLGQYLDERRVILHTTAFLAHEEGVVHIERIMRYGEQSPVFGKVVFNFPSPEQAWQVKTLNYRLINDCLFHRRIRITTAAGEHVLDQTPLEWEEDGRWLLIDGKIGLIKLWGEMRWVFSYQFEEDNLARPFPHRTWSLIIALKPKGALPVSYGSLGGHAVLFRRCSTAEDLNQIICRQSCTVLEKHGVFDINLNLRTWKKHCEIDLTHRLRISSRVINGRLTGE
jgi:hypothetical protein